MEAKLTFPQWQAHIREELNAMQELESCDYIKRFSPSKTWEKDLNPPKVVEGGFDKLLTINTQ